MKLACAAAAAAAVRMSEPWHEHAAALLPVPALQSSDNCTIPWGPAAAAAAMMPVPWHTLLHIP
jgi:hypothetical protein